MKKLLKSVICESVNSAWCTIHRRKVNKCELKKKKKKQRKTRILAKHGSGMLNPNEY